MLFCSNVYSATVYVDADATGGSGDGTSWETAYTDLQDAIDAAETNGGGEVWVAAGTYYPTSQPTEIDTSNTRYNHFALKNGVSVYGGFAGTETDLSERDITANETILSGDIDGDETLNSGNVYHVFYHPSTLALTSDAVLSGFTITGGYADGSSYPYNYGGGMFNSSASPTLTNCTFSGNKASIDGGGMRNVVTSLPTITNCTFSENEAGRNGGGLYNGFDDTSSSPTISNCTFSGNSAKFGGGMYNNMCSLTILNCTFSGNSASINSSGYGGGVLHYGGGHPLTLINCTFSGNSAGTWGGGVCTLMGETETTFNGCTFSGNSAGIRGGAIAGDSMCYGTLTHCILWGDTATASEEQNEVDIHASSERAFYTFSYCDVQGSGGSDDWNSDLGEDVASNWDIDPLFFRDPGANGSDDVGDLHLRPTSPLLDAGSNYLYLIILGIDSDRDGEARIYNGHVDIGSDELVDADGDGLPDYWETLYGVSDPYGDDDGDGLSNLGELNCRTDPTDADSDGDGTEDGDEDYDGDGVTNSVQETPAIVTTAPAGDTNEVGNTTTFTVKLNTQPDGDVVLTVTSNDTTEGTVSPASLTFTTDNWNAYQTVTVIGIDDDTKDGNQTYNVQLSVDDDTTGDTSGYKDIDTATVAVTNVDDETAGFTISAISGNTSESGGTAVFAVRLNSQPTADVTLSITSSDTTEGTVSPSTLTFTSADWNSIGHIVVVTGVDDDITDGDQAYTIVLGAATSTDTNYDGLDPADVTVTNTDDDSPGFEISAISGDTSESGGTATFTIALFTQPTADVTLTLQSSAPSEGTVSPASITFTAGNWNVPQTVTATGMDDDAVDGNQEYTIVTGAASSDDASYDGLDPADVTVTNTDDETQQTGSGGGGSGGCFIGALGLW